MCAQSLPRRSAQPGLATLGLQTLLPGPPMGTFRRPSFSCLGLAPVGAQYTAGTEQQNQDRGLGLVLDTSSLASHSALSGPNSQGCSVPIGPSCWGPLGTLLPCGPWRDSQPPLLPITIQDWAPQTHLKTHSLQHTGACVPGAWAWRWEIPDLPGPSGSWEGGVWCKAQACSRGAAWRTWVHGMEPPAVPTRPRQ